MNPGKIAEISRAMTDYGLEVERLGEQTTGGDIETGSTFEENALLKARFYHHLSGMITAADDSGLEVEALGGAPGVRSARYAGPNATDSQRTSRLLEAMRRVPAERRGARFVCAVAVVWQGGERVFTGQARGVVLDSARGNGGFGYDPIFFYPPLGRSFAELTRAEKWRVSHRGRAFRLMAEWLVSAGAIDTGWPGDRITTRA